MFDKCCTCGVALVACCRCETKFCPVCEECDCEIGGDD